MSQPSTVRTWVDQLGTMQPEEIRELMQNEGVQGVPGAHQSCVISVFLSRKLGEPVSTANTFVASKYEIVDFPSSLTVQTFIRNFDAGRYPELERCP